MDLTQLEQGEYYRINNTKKILYWDGSQWMKPAKDIRGNLGVYIQHLDKQPNNIKSVEKIDINKI
jgi:hypothetical protein